MKRILLLIPIALMSMGADCGSDKECDRDSDCASWQECSAGMCVDKPPGSCQYDYECAPGQDCVSGMCKETPKAPPGTTVTGCNCGTTSALPGQTRQDSRCSSGTSVTLACPGCCATDPYGYCIGVPWREVCQ